MCKLPVLRFGFPENIPFRLIPQSHKSPTKLGNFYNMIKNIFPQVVSSGTC